MLQHLVELLPCRLLSVLYPFGKPLLSGVHRNKMVHEDWRSQDFLHGSAEINVVRSSCAQHIRLARSVTTHARQHGRLSRRAQAQVGAGASGGGSRPATHSPATESDQLRLQLRYAPGAVPDELYRPPSSRGPPHWRRATQCIAAIWRNHLGPPACPSKPHRCQTFRAQNVPRAKLYEVPGMQCIASQSRRLAPSGVLAYEF